MHILLFIVSPICCLILISMVRIEQQISFVAINIFCGLFASISFVALWCTHIFLLLPMVSIFHCTDFFCLHYWKMQTLGLSFFWVCHAMALIFNQHINFFSNNIFYVTFDIKTIWYSKTIHFNKYIKTNFNYKINI